MRLSTLGGVLALPEIFGFLDIFRTILIAFGYFWSVGAYYYDEIRVRGLTTSGANYSDSRLIGFPKWPTLDLCPSSFLFGFISNWISN